MAKVRPNKRSPGTSYSSTFTTIIVGGLCIYGLWMLSSNSFSSPVTTNGAATQSSSSSSSFPSDPLSQPTEPVATKKSLPSFEDTQGDLPEDAIKLDRQEATVPPDDRKDEPPEDKKVPEPEIKVSEAAAGDNAGHEEERNVAVVGHEVDRNVAVVEEIHAQELKGPEPEEVQEKPKIPDAQISEGSSLTQNIQQPEKTMQVHHVHKVGGEAGKKQTRNDQDKPIKLEEQSSMVQNQESAINREHVISDEDQRKRLEQHQQQEDDQIQRGKPQEETRGGATSKDQIEHDEKKPVSEDTKIDPPPENKNKGEPAKSTTIDPIPGGQSTAIPQESNESKKGWATQAAESENQKDRRQVQTGNIEYKWQLCNTSAGEDYIPCLDNDKAIAKLRSRSHYEHRERHCPEEAPTCLVPMPGGYKKSVEWPQSRDKIWYHNVPHTLLAEVKGHQNWVKITGEFLTFPGGGTQFIHGALHYIDFLQQAVPDIAWGKHSRTLLDVGCGVASFGGFLFERDVLAMSFAPKDEHEAQVQFALERGIPAISAVMGTHRLQFPSRVFDVVHCARCRVPWHIQGGLLLLELNRVLRPGGYFIWSATPVYQTLEEDVQIWKAMSNLTVSMCWELVTIKKDKLNSVGAAIYHKPDSNECYDKRKHNSPPMCKRDDDPNAAWYVPLQACMHQVPTQANERGTEWPEEWPQRLQAAPYWLNKSQMGIYGKPAPEDFLADTQHWKGVINNLYLNGIGINWTGVRNIMDMRAVYGGFAAALNDLKVWVMNVVNTDSPDTLPIIYERGLFGIYHDWCESFSTYPRTYDLLHADHLFSRVKKRCNIVSLAAEVDRMARPGGKFIMRDDSATVREVENLFKSLHWEIHFTLSQDKNGILSAQKTDWRPDTYAAAS